MARSVEEEREHEDMLARLLMLEKHTGLWVPPPEKIVQTAKGPKTVSEMREEVTAGGGGAWINLDDDAAVTDAYNRLAARPAPAAPKAKAPA